MKALRDLRSVKVAFAGMMRRACVFWGVPLNASHLPENERRLLAADVRTRRWLTFVQKMPVRVLMAVPLAFLFATRSKGALLWGLLFLGLLYVPLVGVIGFYFTQKLGHLDVHLRRRYSHVSTGIWGGQR